MNKDRFIVNENTSWSLDGHETKLNANTVIIGSPGSGKSTLEAYNILSMNHVSHVIVDPKGVMSKTKSKLIENGYKVLEVDFLDFAKSLKYNPLEYIRKDCAEEDIFAIASALYGNTLCLKDPYWDESAKALLRALISFVYYLNENPETKQKFHAIQQGLLSLMDAIEVKNKIMEHFAKGELSQGVVDRAKKEVEYALQELNSLCHTNLDGPDILFKFGIHTENKEAVRTFLQHYQLSDNNLKSVFDLLNITTQGVDSYTCTPLFEILEVLIGDNLATRQLRGANTSADKTGASTLVVLRNTVSAINFSKGLDVLSTNEIDLSLVGKEKTVMFIRVADYDTSMHRFLNILLTQMIQVLYLEADKYKNKSLKMPVMFWLDDFGSYQINDFEAIISTARSRGIGFNLLFQSLGQLQNNYGYGNAEVLVQCADTLMYLGGNDVKTIDYLMSLTRWDPSYITYLKPFEAILYQRGTKPQKLKLIDFEKEPDKCIWNYMNETNESEPTMDMNAFGPYNEDSMPTMDMNEFDPYIVDSMPSAAEDMNRCYKYNSNNEDSMPTVDMSPFRPNNEDSMPTVDMSPFRPNNEDSMPTADMSPLEPYYWEDQPYMDNEEWEVWEETERCEEENESEWKDPRSRSNFHEIFGAEEEETEGEVTESMESIVTRLTKRNTDN